MFKGWEKITIKDDRGELKDGIAPVVISASRSTDIPAFYPEWFSNRLRKGYVAWVNPFNNTAQYVSFQKTRLIVFWSKNPRPLIPYLDVCNKKNINYYFQFTLNNYDEGAFEPHVPSLADRIETFKSLSEKIGKEKVVWRFDPLILTDKIDVQCLLGKIVNVGEKIHRYTNKLVISFVDISIYRKVQNNLKRNNVPCREFNTDEMMLLAKGLQEINRDWNLEIGTCGEQIDLSHYGIFHNKCIDDELMIKAFGSDVALMNFLGHRNHYQGDIFSASGEKRRPNLKDKGQRKTCECIVSKDIGMYNTCGHLCVYCYANTSEKVVTSNLEKHLPDGESII